MIRSSRQKKYDLIVGANGQDGYFLQKHLQKTDRNIICIDQDGLKTEGAELIEFDISNRNMVNELVKNYPIERIFYLAAYHHSAEQSNANDIQTLKKSMDIHVYALDNFLNAIANCNPQCKIFYAASSHIFAGIKGSDDNNIITIDENSPISPVGWYAISKTAGVELMRSARKSGIYAVSGFLFNHESERRPRSFLSSKLIHGALDVYVGKSQTVELFDLETQIDWGYAPDFVKAMDLSLSSEKPSDYVIATGKLRTTADFANSVFSKLDLNWKDHIKVLSAKESKIGSAKALVGNSEKISNTTGWKHQTNFDEMVAYILQASAEDRGIELNSS